MLQIRELTDMTLVDEAFNSPNNRPWACSDRNEDGFPVRIPYLPHKILYIGCYEGEVFLGCVLGIKKNDELSLHIAFLPVAYGQTLRIGKQILGWLGRNYPQFRVYVAMIAGNNKRAQRYVREAGFQLRALHPDGWLKDGTEHGKHEYVYEVKNG